MIVNLNFLSKFQIHWHGHYCVIEGFLNESIQLENFQGTQFTTRINGNMLRLYYIYIWDGFKIWKDNRCQNIKAKSDLESPSLVIIINIEQIKLKISLSPQRQRDIRNVRVT